MNILVFSPDYPDDRRSVFPFVKQLVDEISNQGNKIEVIAPYSLTHNKRLIKRKEVYYVGANEVMVYRPYYLSFSELHIGRVSLSDWAMRNAFKRGLKMLKTKPDVVYGHFWPTAYKAYPYAKKHHLPLFVATGESKVVFTSDTQDKKEFCDYLAGVISVSSKNIEESVCNGMRIKDKCLLAPNAYNPHIFYRKDKQESRNLLNLPQDAFIIVFCGAFVHRKGVKKLSDAIDSINGKPVYSLFIGRPETELPTCKNILFQGPVQHNKLTDYLSAADVFVLPTLNEGCCNAIIEAIACGLPIISSDRPFNWDVLNKSNAILVDPEDSDQIARAIVSLRDDKDFRNKLAEGSMVTAKDLTIDKRAQKIIEFIKKRK